MLRQILRSAQLVVSDLSGTLLFALLLALGVDVLIATVAGIAMALGTAGRLHGATRSARCNG